MLEVCVTLEGVADTQQNNGSAFFLNSDASLLTKWTQPIK